MAIANSNTYAHTEITCPPPVFDLEINTLLETPVGISMDLFQVIDACQSYVDALVGNDNIAERMALCGRLFAGLEVMKVALAIPLPAHLIEHLTTDVSGAAGGYICPLSMDSETLRSYCAALTILLLNQQQTPEQTEHIIEMLFEMIYVLAEDLKAPRFIRTDCGLTMIDGEDVPLLH